MRTAGVWLSEQAQADRFRWALWLPVGIGTGIAVYFALAFEPPLWLGPLLLMLMAAFTLASHRVWQMAVVWFSLASVAIGFTAAQLRTQWVSAPVLQDEVGPVRLVGRVFDVDERPKAVRLLLRPEALGDLAPRDWPARVRVSLRQEGAWQIDPGERVLLRAILRPPPGPSIPGAFDFARHAFFDRLGAVGFAVGDFKRLSPVDGEEKLTWLERWRIDLAATRHRIAERIRRKLPGDTGAVAAALMTGERGPIPESVLQSMRDSGLAHLLAISGLHIGLVAGLLFFASRAALALWPYVTLRYPIKKWAAAIALCGAAGYLLLVGAPVSTQRAFVMVGLVLLAVMIDRSAVSMHVVAWAAAVVLLLAPEELLSAGFQMSFAAVIGLIAVYEAVSARRGAMAPAGERGRFRLAAAYLAGLALTSLVATAATGPLAAFHFQRIALYGVAANMLAVPLTAFWIMPWVLAAFFLMPFGLEGLALVPLDRGIGLLLATAKSVSAWPGAASLVPAMPAAVLPIAALGGLWLCLWQARWRFLGLLGIGLAVFLALWARPADLLIDGTGRLFAVRLQEELYLAPGRSQRFERELWLRRAAQVRAAQIPADSNVLRCDAIGCVYRRNGVAVSILHDERAVQEDCAIVDAVVASVPVSRYDCGAPAVLVDRFDLWREGGHALWLGADRIVVKSVRDARGVRPWAPAR
ncbi:MAG: ComEC/Rec2 family competence protein [Rhodovibrionaceae bacterium]|nr:ComEC/Rec2 family competence protein [Rhodovibrionaceae bacterium]